jgi:hypothetical protein
MKSNASKLIDIAGAPFLPNGTASDLDSLDEFGQNGIQIKEILTRKNGFFCFEQALRFFPTETTETSWGFLEWNSPSLWKDEYRGLADNVFCFAEDIFGNQFGISNSSVCFLNAETGDMETIACSIEEYIEKLLSDFNYMTGYQFAHEWQEYCGCLSGRHRLLPKKPFVLGGDYDLSNLVALDSVRVMKTLGNLASQIHDLPEGAQIQFRIF